MQTCANCTTSEPIIICITLHYPCRDSQHCTGAESSGEDTDSLCGSTSEEDDTRQLGVEEESSEDEEDISLSFFAESDDDAKPPPQQAETSSAHAFSKPLYNRPHRVTWPTSCSSSTL